MVPEASYRCNRYSVDVVTTSHTLFKRATLFRVRLLGICMTELPHRLQRAFADHTAFEQHTDGQFISTSTTFEGHVEATEIDGRFSFVVESRVPLLGTVTEEEVADVVEDGWYETFELRTQDIGGIFRTDRDLSPTVTRHAETAAVEVTLEDINPRRGVDDAAAVIDYVEGTFVQGIIPGYTYTEPIDGILERARDAAGGR